MLIDTGADVTVIAERDWPKTWPLSDPQGTLVGVRGNTATKQSRHMVTLQTPDRPKCLARPYVAPIPLNLLGRDVLGQMGCVVSTKTQNF